MEPILNDGGISANWILVLITSIAGFLFWKQLDAIKDTLKELAIEIRQIKEKQTDHERDIAVNQRDHENISDRLDRLEKEGSEQFSSIITKLEALKG